MKFGMVIFFVLQLCYIQCVVALEEQREKLLRNGSLANGKEFPLRSLRRRAADSYPVVYCIETALPNEVVCELGYFFSSSRWKELQPLTFSGISFQFKSPSDPSNNCHAIYKQKDASSSKRFVYSGVGCKVPGGDKTLPKGMKVSDAAKVQLFAYKPGDIKHACVFLLGKSGVLTGDVEENGRKTKAQLVKYEYERIKCKSSNDKDEDEESSIFTIFNGREILERRIQPVCVGDGRRECRPVRS